MTGLISASLRVRTALPASRRRATITLEQAWRKLHGFEPAWELPLLVFKTSALDRSAKLPYWYSP